MSFAFSSLMDSFEMFEMARMYAAPFEASLSNIVGVYLPVLAVICVVRSLVLYRRSMLVISRTMPVVLAGNYFYIGQVFEFLKSPPWDLMTEWHGEFGQIYAFGLFGRCCVSVSDPKILKVLLQTKMMQLKKDVPFTYKPFMPILGTGLVTSDGKAWALQRSRVSRVLRFDILDEIPGITLRAVQRMFAAIDDAQEDQQGNKVVEVGELFRHLTLQVICETLLTIDAKECSATLAHMYLPIVEESNRRVWNPFRELAVFSSQWWSNRENVRNLDEYFVRLLNERHDLRRRERTLAAASSRRKDVLDRVMDAYESDDNGKVEWNTATITQLRDELKTFILAGHETSAAMLTWATYELSHDAEIAEIVRHESDGVFRHVGAGSAANQGKEQVREWDVKDLPRRDTELCELHYAEG